MSAPRRLLAGAVTALVLCATCSGRSSAADRSWRDSRRCGSKDDGGLSVDLRWQMDGPFLITMTRNTARYIAVRVSAGEHEPDSAHPPAADVACDIAESVAMAAGQAWSAHQVDQFRVRSGWTGQQPGPQFLFQCKVTSHRAGGVTGTCTHPPDSHIDEIRVAFMTRPT